MKTLQIHMPDELDLTAGATPEELEALARVAFAIRLFEMGKVTSGQAVVVMFIRKSGIVHVLNVVFKFIDFTRLKGRTNALIDKIAI